MKNINIAFIGYGILGDFIVCLRSLELLRETYPSAHITYIGNKNFAQLGNNNYHINEIIEPDDDFWNIYKTKDSLTEKWQIVFEESNLIVNHRMDPESHFKENIKKLGYTHLQKKCESFCLNAESKIFLDGKVKDQSNSAYEQVAELLVNIGIVTDKWTPELKLPQEFVEKAKEETDQWQKELGAKSPKYIIGFHAGASNMGKCTPIKIWADIFRKINTDEIAIMLIYGPAEQDRLPEIKKELSVFNVLYITNKELNYAAAMLSCCNLFVGHDTGVAHIASALHLPSLLLFGKTSLEHVWRPPYFHTNVINVEDISSPNKDQVAEAISSMLKLDTYEKLVLTFESEKYHSKVYYPAPDLPLPCHIGIEPEKVVLFHQACYKGDLILIKNMLKENHELLNQTVLTNNALIDRKCNVPAIFWAVLMGNENTVKYLIEQGADYENIFYAVEGHEYLITLLKTSCFAFNTHKRAKIHNYLLSLPYNKHHGFFCPMDDLSYHIGFQINLITNNSNKNPLAVKALKIHNLLTDIHTHYGPYGDYEFSPEEVLQKFKDIGLKRVGIMQTPMKSDVYMPDNHKLLDIISLANGEIEILPILMTSPAMIKNDPSFSKVQDIPYKIIKVHPYAHNWAKYPNLVEILLNHAKAKSMPLMIHTGYDESEPQNFEKWYKKYPEIMFILAHGKPFDQALAMIKKYKNVWIDISFTDISEIHKIITKTNSDTKRFLFATDMPINEIFFDISTIDYLESRIFEIIEKFGMETIYNWGILNITTLLNHD